MAYHENRDSEDLWAVQATLNGHPRAFEAIVERYTPMLYSLAYRLLGPGAEVEDAVQEIFEKAFRNLARFRIKQRFFPWLYTIAMNHLRSLQRRRRRHNRLKMGAGDPQAILERVATAAEDPAADSELREGEQLAQQALDSLRTEYREVFVLRQIQGLSVQETAEALKIPQGTVKTYLHRARREMIDFLAEIGWERNPGD